MKEQILRDMMQENNDILAGKLVGILGKTLTKIEVAKRDSNEIIFTTNSGEKYRMFHNPECLEAGINNIIGNVEDLIGSPLLVAEEISNNQEELDNINYDWIFYKLETTKGCVTISWRNCYDEYCTFFIDLKKITKE